LQKRPHTFFVSSSPLDGRPSFIKYNGPRKDTGQPTNIVANVKPLRVTIDGSAVISRQATGQDSPLGVQ